MTRLWYQSFTDPDSDRAYFDRLVEFVRGVASPGVAVDVYGIRPGDHDLHPVTELRGSLTTLRAALRAKAEGYDAVVIGHFQEPGLDMVRASVDLPIIGLGESTMLHACTLGRKIGLITINPIFIPYHQRQIAAAGLSERVVAVRAVVAEVGDYMRGFDDKNVREQMFDDFLRQAQPLIDDGVEVIVPAGGLPMLLFANEAGITQSGVAILNGLPVAIEAAQTAVRLRTKYGVAPARVGMYQPPTVNALDQLLGSLSENSGIIGPVLGNVPPTAN